MRKIVFDLVFVAGTTAATAGVYMCFGLDISLIVGGCLLMILALIGNSNATG
jgi:hypothetical protein